MSFKRNFFSDWASRSPINGQFGRLFISIRNLIESSAMVRETIKNIKDLDLFFHGKDAETGQRGIFCPATRAFWNPTTGQR